MKKKSTEQYQIQVGAFLTIGILLAMILILVLGSKKTFFQPQYVLVARFDDISGLRTGAPVQLAGVNVGYVEKITFSSNLKKKKVKVHIKVNKEFQERVREDSVATVMTQGLLGDRMIYISVGSVDTKILKDGDTLQARNPSGFNELVEKGEKLMDKADRFVANADNFMTRLNAIGEEVIRGEGLVHEVIYDKQGKEVFTSLNNASRNMEVFTRNLASIAGKINQGKGNLGALVNDTSLYYDLKTLLGKANRNKLVRAVIRYTLKTKDKDQLQ